MILPLAATSIWAPEQLPRLPQHLVEMLLEFLKMPAWLVTLGGLAAAAGTVVGVFLGGFALLSLIERKTLARVQNRIGPNRAGPFGIFQPVADGIKMLTKEDIVPAKAEWLLHLLAPILIVVPSILALGVIPYGREWTPVPLELGLLLFFAVGSVTEVAIFMAGWSSGS
ncbi:MAG: NADH-quinone oxidoreductase subunit H, partial [Verrucomicrobiae bacterium]|nr:NADH-quinone oxidoreductase subunit H [Verrucomicrobiae bacterium]